MSVNFLQPFINIRERLNALHNHTHNALYEKKGTFLGKNLLINPNKTVSQRGDFSTPTPITTNNYYIDKNRVSFFGNVLTLEHLPLDLTINARPIRYEVVSSTGGAIINFQIIENYKELGGKIVTYTVQIKPAPNSSAYVYISDSGLETYSKLIEGDGTFKTISITLRIKENTTGVKVGVSDTKVSGPIAVHPPGDYIEIGNEQLELGSKFTGFEYVLPAVNLSNCRRTMVPLTSAGSYDVIGIFVATSATQLLCTLHLTPMDDASGITLIGSSIPLLVIGPMTGTITPGSLSVFAPFNDSSLGKVTLTIVGTGFAIGQIIMIVKNNDTNLIYLEST